MIEFKRPSFKHYKAYEDYLNENAANGRVFQEHKGIFQKFNEEETTDIFTVIPYSFGFDKNQPSSKQATLNFISTQGGVYCGSFHHCMIVRAPHKIVMHERGINDAYNKRVRSGVKLVVILLLLLHYIVKSLRYNSNYIQVPTIQLADPHIYFYTFMMIFLSLWWITDLITFIQNQHAIRKDDFPTTFELSFLNKFVFVTRSMLPFLIIITFLLLFQNFPLYLFIEFVIVCIVGFVLFVIDFTKKIDQKYSRYLKPFLTFVLVVLSLHVMVSMGNQLYKGAIVREDGIQVNETLLAKSVRIEGKTPTPTKTDLDPKKNHDFYRIESKIPFVNQIVASEVYSFANLRDYKVYRDGNIYYLGNPEVSEVTIRSAFDNIEE